jgi:pSer/pThr/pTyr-binding forkhead associated (FHA) protein
MSILTTPAAAIHLMDASFERQVKSWRFAAQYLITLGRSEDQDIEISDPYVSRNHVEFHFEDGQWVLHSKGRNGVLVQNESVIRYVLTGDTNFRLGPNGPALRFEIGGTAPANADGGRTLSYDTMTAVFFGIDQRKVEREVEVIAEGDYFKTLQEKAAGLRQQRGN